MHESKRRIFIEFHFDLVFDVPISIARKTLNLSTYILGIFFGFIGQWLDLVNKFSYRPIIDCDYYALCVKSRRI